ncbi:MAG: hypothetical protein RSC93_08565 [Erysipelotrichaceae bacterium]
MNQILTTKDEKILLAQMYLLQDNKIDVEHLLLFLLINEETRLSKILSQKYNVKYGDIFAYLLLKKQKKHIKDVNYKDIIENNIDYDGLLNNLQEFLHTLKEEEIIPLTLDALNVLGQSNPSWERKNWYELGAALLKYNTETITSILEKNGISMKELQVDYFSANLV